MGPVSLRAEPIPLTTTSIMTEQLKGESLTNKSPPFPTPDKLAPIKSGTTTRQERPEKVGSLECESSRCPATSHFRRVRSLSWTLRIVEKSLSFVFLTLNYPHEKTTRDVCALGGFRSLTFGVPGASTTPKRRPRDVCDGHAPMLKHTQRYMTRVPRNTSTPPT